MVEEFEGLIEKEVVKFDEVSREEAVLGFIIDVEVVGTELVELLVPGVVVEGVMAGKMLFNLFISIPIIRFTQYLTKCLATY